MEVEREDERVMCRGMREVQIWDWRVVIVCVGRSGKTKRRGGVKRESMGGDGVDGDGGGKDEVATRGCGLCEAGSMRGYQRVDHSYFISPSIINDFIACVEEYLVPHHRKQLTHQSQSLY